MTTGNAPPIEEQIAWQQSRVAEAERYKDASIIDEQSILASLEKLAALESQPVPDVPRLRRALEAMMSAYQRRIRTDCTEDQLKQEPWRCAEYIEAEAALKPKLHFTQEWLNRQCQEPDIPSCPHGVVAGSCNKCGQPVPVEPFRRFRGVLKPVDRGMWVNGPCDYYHDAEVDTRIDSLQSALQRAQEERDTNGNEWARSAEALVITLQRAEKAESINRRMVELLKEPSDDIVNAGLYQYDNAFVETGEDHVSMIFKAMSAELLKEIEK